ncbi:MAG: SMP-30/gluconolactonase/LRE family protein [Pseudomonadota bacterium]
MTDTVSELGEGPIYCGRRETLYWFDIVGRKRHAHNFKSATTTTQPLPEMASAMAFVDENHDLIFTQSGLWSREIATGCWSPICAIEPDRDDLRSNDARVHQSGAIWLGTMSKTKERGAGAIYHYRQGSLTKLYDNMTIPNAICFSPDGCTAYFTDTMIGKLMSVSINKEDGLPVGKPAVFFQQADDDIGGIDGAICDANGRIWNARWGAGCIDRYSPNGRREVTIPIPVSQGSCPAFIDGRRMAVTTAWEDMDDAQRQSDPDAGKTVLIEFDNDLSARFEPSVLT